jgi:Protein of unknown function (DUF1275)
MPRNFIILFGIFTAHVTGNIALAGSSFVSEDAETTITRLLMLPTFILTVALTSLLARYARKRQWRHSSIPCVAARCSGRIYLTDWDVRRGGNGNPKRVNERIKRCV